MHNRWQMIRMNQFCVYTCNSVLCSKLYALGLPSSVENATLPSRNGEISLYSLVQNARDSDSPFLLMRRSDKLSGNPYVSRHVALLMPFVHFVVVVNGLCTNACNRIPTQKMKKIEKNQRNRYGKLTSSAYVIDICCAHSKMYEFRVDKRFHSKSIEYSGYSSFFSYEGYKFIVSFSV